MYMQGVLCTVTQRIVYLMCLFCGHDQGRFYACSYVTYTQNMYNRALYTYVYNKHLYVYIPTPQAAEPTVFSGLATGLV
jgi:hypothetical protein